MTSPSPPLQSSSPPRSAAFDQLIKTLEEWSTSLPKGPLHRLRRAGWERLHALAIPRARAAPYRSLRLSTLAECSASLVAPISRDGNFTALPPLASFSPPSAKCTLTLIDGRYSPKHSQLEQLPPDVEIIDLAAAFGAFGAHIKRRSVDEEGEFFALASAALAQEGLTIYVPPDCRVEDPLHIHHIATANASSACFSRIHLILGARSSLHLGICGTRSGRWHSEYLEVTLEEGARLKVDEHIMSAPEAFCFRPTRALLKKDADLQVASFTRGSFCTWQDIDVRLLGEGGNAEIAATHALAGRDQSTTSIHVAHLSPGAISQQSIRSVLGGNAKAAFRGKIFVAKGASQTRSYQRHKNLLLSDQAIAESQPELEILNDDVKASHGATAGALDEEQLFYLQSRGISAKSAKALLIQGFVEEGLAHMGLEFVRDASRRALDDFPWA